jgi:hypothetical protein
MCRSPRRKLPACFEVLQSENTITGNAAAGSERLGWLLNGPPCTPVAGKTSVIANNSAHSAVVGVLMQANTLRAGCTLLQVRAAVAQH